MKEPTDMLSGYDYAKQISKKDIVSGYDSAYLAVCVGRFYSAYRYGRLDDKVFIWRALHDENGCSRSPFVNAPIAGPFKREEVPCVLRMLENAHV